MPRNLRNGNFRGRGGRNHTGERQYYDSSAKYNEHDDERVPDWNDRNDRNRNDRNMTDVKRRVSFKPFNGGRGKGRINENQIRAHFNDDDEAMGGDTFDGDELRTRVPGRKFQRQRRSGSPIPRGASNTSVMRKKFVASNNSWYEVRIPYGHKYEKDFILRSIQHAISPQMFIPLYYKNINGAALFYIEDYNAANAIVLVNRTIPYPDGRKMVLQVRNNHPVVTANEQLIGRMKQAMVKRYNPQTKGLNLEKFHADPELSDIFCALFRPQIMLAAIDIIAQHIPELEALNLNDNKLYMLEHLKSAATKMPHLKVLYLARNRIPYVNTLDSLKNLKLIELNLEDNPLKQRYNDNTFYVRARGNGYALKSSLPSLGAVLASSVRWGDPGRTILYVRLADGAVRRTGDTCVDNKYQAGGSGVWFREFKKIRSKTFHDKIDRVLPICDCNIGPHREMPTEVLGSRRIGTSDIVRMLLMCSIHHLCWRKWSIFYQK